MEDAAAALNGERALKMPWSVPANGLILHGVHYGAAFHDEQTPSLIRFL
ncbi:MAG: hypothetical protein IPN29_16035 [Saprospiraceae bacterium]|nr:hypothetical protein [Saprospiraceae bacterium]